LPVKRVLVVEPEGTLRALLQNAGQEFAQIDADATAPVARTHLFARPYDWLITNIRLEAYNGLHLAYLANAAALPLKVLVYGEKTDLSLAREAQQLGAFFETKECVHQTIGAYLCGQLPPRDRRDPAQRDRRLAFRGGRRCSDALPVAH
jgi:DNA-binding NtrC family response regulator